MRAATEPSRAPNALTDLATPINPLVHVTATGLHVLITPNTPPPTHTAARHIRAARVARALCSTRLSRALSAALRPCSAQSSWTRTQQIAVVIAFVVDVVVVLAFSIVVY